MRSMPENVNAADAVQEKDGKSRTRYFKLIKDCYRKGRIHHFGEVFAVNDGTALPHYFMEISKKEYDALSRSPEQATGYARTQQEIDIERREKAERMAQMSSILG